jgi:hypothetical protein
VNAVSINLPKASGVLINTGGCLVIHAARETSGSAAAVYRLWDSDRASGQLLLPISLTAKESTRDYFQAHHLTFKTSLYYELVSGQLEGSVSVMCDHRCEEVWRAQIDAAFAAYE